MNTNKVVWTEGLFIQPHHFQQFERYLENFVERRGNPLWPWGWGFSALRIDPAQLKLGKFALHAGSGVFRDGTPFTCGIDDPMPQPLDIPLDCKDQRVVLALPLPVAGESEVALDAAGARLARYIAGETEVDDVTALARPATLLVGRLNARLMLERDASGAYTALPVARILERRPDGEVVLDERYIPPMLSSAADPRLDGYLRELIGLVRQRALHLAQRINQPGRGSVAEVAEYLLLQTLNRYAPLLSHLLDTPSLHPARLFSSALMLAGDLAVFGREDRLPADFPSYDHDDVNPPFVALMHDLRHSLALVMESGAVAIDLEDRKFGVRVAIVPDVELLRGAGFVLAVRAQVPAEALRLRLPTQIKIGPIDKIRDLINLQLPGIGVQSLPVAPRQIPYHAGFHYFELDTNNELWPQLERSGGLALHLAGEFPGLELEFWAIKRQQ